MKYRSLVLASLMLLAGFAAAQTPTPAKNDEDAAKLEKAAVELLRETSGEVGRLRTMENRISFDSELASLMWFHDEKEAKAMYGAVVSDFKQLMMQLDMQMNAPQVPDDDDNPTGGLFGSYGKNKVERKFHIAMEVRKQIAMSLAEHAPDLAYNFFYDSINLISNPQLRKENETSDRYFEAQLMLQIAETDAAKAIFYGNESIKRGLDTNHIELLKKIYAKDADKGVEFGASILSRLKTDKVDKPYFYNSLLSFGAENLEASKKPGGKKAVYDRNDLRDIAEMFAQLILDGKSGGAEFADQIDKYSPGRGAQIRAKYKNTKPDDGYASMMYASNAVRMTSNSKSSGSGYGTSDLSSNSNTVPDSVRIAREREAAEKKMMDDIKALGTKPLPKEQRDEVVAQARKIISQTPGKDKKIVALSFLAAQVAHAGDKELADEIMLDADRLVNPQPKNYQDYLLSWMLASGYAETNPDKAFPLLESTIMRANDTLAAFIKIGEFIDVNDEMIEDGEVQVGMFGGSMIREVTSGLGMASGTIRSLAKADFAKTRNLTNTFDRPEIRVLAKMMVLRSVLDKGKKGEAAGPPEVDPENKGD
jgi:hypothetical protein